MFTKHKDQIKLLGSKMLAVRYQYSDHMAPFWRWILRHILFIPTPHAVSVPSQVEPRIRYFSYVASDVSASEKL